MTPREPDRFEEQARKVYSHLMQRGGNARVADLTAIAAALRTAEADALERARKAVSVLRGPAVADAVARIDWLIAESREGLASPAAAPAAEECEANPDHCEKWHNHAPPSEPAAPAPSPLSRTIDFLESIWRTHDSGRVADDAHTLAAELRQYIASPAQRAEARIAELEALISDLRDYAEDRRKYADAKRVLGAQNSDPYLEQWALGTIHECDAVLERLPAGTSKPGAGEGT